MAVFSFNNQSNVAAYFVYETVPVASNGQYNVEASPKAASGSFSSLTGINEDHIVQSDYTWGVVVPKGESSIEFFPETVVLIGEVYFRGTGNLTVGVTRIGAEQTLSPSELHGRGTLNSIKVVPLTTTTVTRTSAYRYYFDGGTGLTDWNTAINAASSQAVDTLFYLQTAFATGRGSNIYVTNRLMVNFDLSGVLGTITAINLPFSTTNTPTAAFDVNIYSAGTAALGGGIGEYSYYKDEGSTAFSTPQTINASTSYTFSLNAAALTIANTKPSNFVIALIHEFDYTATAPSPIDTYYNCSINTVPEPHFPLVITSV